MFSEEMWSELVRMRENQKAPVDTMGCTRLARSTSAPNRRFQILLSLLLSSQTKDQITAQAMHQLYAAFSDELAAKDLAECSLERIAGLIYPVGFYRRKAEYIQQVSLRVVEKGDIPDCVEELCELPGVGPKMAHLTMWAAWNITTGIGVDTHVHRITMRLGWHNEKDPERARLVLQGIVPESKWGELNGLLVGLGQTMCLPRKPLCKECALVRWCKEGKRHADW